MHLPSSEGILQKAGAEARLLLILSFLFFFSSSSSPFAAPSFHSPSTLPRQPILLFRSHAPAWVPGFSNSQPKSLSRPATLSHPPPSSPPAVPPLALSDPFSNPSHLLSTCYLPLFLALLAFFPSSFRRLLLASFALAEKKALPPKNESRPPTAFPFLSLFFSLFPLSFFFLFSFTFASFGSFNLDPPSLSRCSFFLLLRPPPLSLSLSPPLSPPSLLFLVVFVSPSSFLSPRV
ncbi:uncharacterized protein ARB_03826 [Trichophyton benhamiae CBS 112371]|uniref:Transmembrane protein n=1 Tax=Arthroderma benhamiae (strain ATCC MYA-4681 / CBS 112371) TaxID=663331 RepID=D4B5R9_ARTBC|nr:uncharacterized protein ARB_03826 [Trichophyton benhamiae CBS 112371]EFE29255.1 hypothetical protein ARB_03826 [Trichophyton benhamiae CBS 112371]